MNVTQPEGKVEKDKMGLCVSDSVMFLFKLKYAKQGSVCSSDIKNVLHYVCRCINLESTGG